MKGIQILLLMPKPPPTSWRRCHCGSRRVCVQRRGWLELIMISILDYKTSTGNFKMRKASCYHQSYQIFGLNFSEIKVPPFLLVSCYAHTIPFPQESLTLLFRKTEFPEEISQSLFLPVFWKHTQYSHLRFLEWQNPIKPNAGRFEVFACLKWKRTLFPLDRSTRVDHILSFIQKQLS